MFERKQGGSNEEHRSQPQQQRSQTNSNNNTRSTKTEKEHSGSSGATSGSAGGDDPSQRRKRIEMICQQPIRLVRFRYYQKKPASTFPEKFDKDVETAKEANQCLVERMLHYVQVMHHRAFGNVPVPENAIRKIFEVVQESSALNNFYELNRDNMVVQVDEIFSGVKADRSNWSVTFTIDADIPPVDSRQLPHFGITIERENRSFRTLNHAFVTETIPYGRPRPDQNESLTDVFVVKEFEIHIDGGTFKHQVKITMLKRKPSSF